MRVLVFFNESVGFFGFRHFVRRCCAVFLYEFIGFLRPELFFQWECLFFVFKHFVRRRRAVFSYEFEGFFKARIVFSMMVFVFFGFRHFVRRCCAVFSYEFSFFGFMHFVRRCCAVFSYEFIRFLEPECFFNESVCFLLQAFCKTVLRRFFPYEFSGFLRPELLFQWERLFFYLQAFCKTVLCCVVFSYEFINVAGYIEFQLFQFLWSRKKNKYIEYCHATRPVQILMKRYWKIIFSSFWQDLGFGECFFSIQILIKKSIEKLIFPAFGKSLVLGNGFF